MYYNVLNSSYPLQFTIQHFEELVDRFNISLNEHNNLEKLLITTLRDIEKCLNLTGDNFTHQTQHYLNVKKIYFIKNL